MVRSSSFKVLCVMQQDFDGELSDTHRYDSLRAMLLRLGTKLDDIASCIDHTQSVIAAATWSIASDNSGYVSSMQQADHAAQKISGIAAIISALADEIPVDLQVDTKHLKNGIKIASLHDVLHTHNGNASVQSIAESGEIDLL
jgi:hypothetical protein